MSPQDPTKQEAAASTSASAGKAPTDAHHPNYPRERTIAQPTRYHPNEDPMDYILQFERIARGNNWQDKAKLDTLGVYLDGSAQIWYEDNHHLWHDYGMFKDAFLAKFMTPMKKAQAHQRLLAYRQCDDENVEYLIANLNRLFRAAQVTEDHMKQSFLTRALDNKISLVVLPWTHGDYRLGCGRTGIPTIRRRPRIHLHSHRLQYFTRWPIAVPYKNANTESWIPSQ